MKKLSLYLITGFIFSYNASAIFNPEVTYRDSSINDGPYIFIEDNQLKATWIENNSLRKEFVTNASFGKMKNKFNLKCNYSQLHTSMYLKPRFRQSYNQADSIAVLSDIHGEYNTYSNLLKVNGIIDDDLNWSFGNGHLVILGDVFDRGDNVTELLWHLFCLFFQAEKMP